MKASRTESYRHKPAMGNLYSREDKPQIGLLECGSGTRQQFQKSTNFESPTDPFSEGYLLPRNENQPKIRGYPEGLVRNIHQNHSSRNLRFRIGRFQEPESSHFSISNIIKNIEASLEQQPQKGAWSSPFDSSRTTIQAWSSLTDIQQNKGDPVSNCQVSPFNSPHLSTGDWRLQSDAEGRCSHSQGQLGRVSVMGSPLVLSQPESVARVQHPLDPTTSEKQTADSQILLELEHICQFKLEDLTTEQILEFSTRDKHISLAFQRYLYTVWMKPAPTFTAVITKHLEVLATHQYGNYVLQILSLRDPKIRNFVEETARMNFLQWLGNEYSSRLLQHLIELSPSFQWFVSTKFSLRFDLCRQDLSSLFVAIALIKSARDPGMLLFLDNYLQEKTQAALENRYMRRLIVFYCEKAPQATLDLIFREMVDLFPPDKLIRERTLVSILQGIMSRKHAAALALLEKLVKQRPEQLVKDGFFRFLIKKCFIFPQSIPAISESISRGMQGYLKSKRAASLEPEFLKEVKLVCKFFGICLNNIDVQTSKTDFKRVFMQAASRQSLHKYISGVEPQIEDFDQISREAEKSSVGTQKKTFSNKQGSSARNFSGRAVQILQDY